MSFPTFDIAAVDMLKPTADATLEEIADDMRRRYSADTSLVTFIDQPGDRQVLKGVSKSAPAWTRARATPLCHSICKLVAANAAPFVTADARSDPRLTDNLAPSELGVVGYLGVPIFAPGDEAVGALCVVTDAPRDWTEEEVADLRRFARGIDHLLESRMATLDTEILQNRLQAATAAHEETLQTLDAATRNLPGAVYRYALFEDGTDAIEYVSPSCTDIWGYTEEELKGDPSLLWQTILPEELERVRDGVQRSAREMTQWRCDFHIRTPQGTLRHLRGYGTPEEIPGGVGVAWTTLIIDLDSLAAAPESASAAG